MGLLDDAIREHLDLKRRRGADPSDVARQEDEALGPVRRGEPEDELDHEELELDDEAEPADVSDEPAYELAPESEVHAEPESESSTPPHGDPLGDEAFAGHSAHQDTREFSAGELQDALDRRDDEEEPAAELAPEIVPADDEDAEDDVLEETPDFLQETPEHDRLWFEQKPPKDFDF